MGENVVFSYHPAYRPAYHYLSIPSVCVGGGNTLAEVRLSYRSDLAAVLRVGRDQLPPITEHLETFVSGMWVRTDLGVREDSWYRQFVKMLNRSDPALGGFRAYLDCASAPPGDTPSVVLVQPHDIFGFVIDQMTASDALWLVYRTGDVTVRWIGIYGSEAAGADAICDTVDGGKLRDMPIRTFLKKHAPEGVYRLRLLPGHTGADD